MSEQVPNSEHYNRFGLYIWIFKLSENIYTYVILQGIYVHIF